jgi:tight adherence protein B
VLLQRDAGGDLAALLRELAASGEAADRAERDARAATAQARFTAWLVFALPLAGAGLAELAAPGFAASLVANPVSAFLAGAAVVLQVAALAAISHLTSAAA